MCVPGEEEWLVEVVEDIDDEVVVGDGVNLRPRGLPIDQYPLQCKPIHSASFHHAVMVTTTLHSALSLSVMLATDFTQELTTEQSGRMHETSPAA